MSDDDRQSNTSMESPDSHPPKVYPSLQTEHQEATTVKRPKPKGPSSQTPSGKPSRKQNSSPMTSSKKDILVYIPDIPSNIPENDLEKMLQTRLKSSARVTAQDIKCHSKLGIAVVRLSTKEDKEHLVSNVLSMVLDPQRGTNISFVKELELESYIVLDQHKKKIPSSDEVAHFYVQAYNVEEPTTCDLVSVVFPNIFRIVSKSLDDLITVASSTNFCIDNIPAIIYSHAECSFFQELPANTTDDKLSSAIKAQIGDKELLATSFHVQFDKKTGNAVILMPKSVKQWITQGFLTIDGRNISKKAKLACRVLVAPILRDFDIDSILDHKLFADHVVTHNHINNHLILELDSMDAYNNCLSVGALRIGKTLLNITEHATVSDPEANEIDAETWYETDMKQIKPDIMTIINDHDHPIFHYKWNAKNWIEQFKKVESTERHVKDDDLTRHLLRVTVMLNTIGVVRKQRYMVGKNEVILKPERMQTIVYNHASKLSTGKKISVTEMKAPYPSTTISVVNQDCLVLYEKLVSEGYRPLLLNMANATNPGGGYRKGDGAQEENLFRRSDYYQSLDLGVADNDRSERLYCTAKYDLKTTVGPNGLYPMEDYGAIYTSGITVFRQTESQGYAFMKDPLYNVCSIAMAAYRNPELSKDNKMFANKFAVGTQKKIENVFSIAHHHKHDCLVLSALGCGAFKNPPGHVASIFKSVILQYAGFFDKIYFAIVDDHNTGNKINPKGNFLPFKDLLDGLIMKPPTTLRVDAVFGPNRILDKSSDGQLTLSDVCILNSKLCTQGGKCNELRNDQHIATFSHPPMCPYQDPTSSCNQMDDETHIFTFTHIVKCKHGGECNNSDPKHLSEFEHPELCKAGGHCGNMSHQHLLDNRHVPLCRDGLTCTKFLKRDADHCNSYRHCKTICPYDNCCVNFHDKIHIENTVHSFRPPCPFTPYNCSMYVELAQAANENIIPSQVEHHCLTYSHVCLYGRQCKRKDINHLENTIHIARQPCPDQDRCPKLSQEDHLESFSHPDIRDIRLFCKYPGFECRQKLEVQHLKKYRHGRNDNHVTVALSGGLNAFVNFVRNQSQMIKNVNNYVETSNWTKAKISPEILNWIRALQPVHRCAKLIFESILVHGHVMSRDYMHLLRKPKHVARAVQQHSRVRLIFLKHHNPALKQHAKELIKMLVEAEFAKAEGGGTISADASHDYNTNAIIKKLKPPLDDNDIKVIQNWSIKIAQASIKLNETPMGIGYDVDQKLGTDKQVFSILGPHRGYYYGDIIIVFKQELMLHPDSNFSIQAGTSFHSGSAYKHRPWLKDPVSLEKRVEQFHTSKLHCSVARYEYAAAAELVALTGLSNKSMNVNLQDVLKRWMDVDSHEVFESHLPQLIPLDYIDCVYMPQNVFDSLTPEAQQSARGALKQSLIITKLDLDLSLVVPGKTVPLDSTRQVYLKYITGKICEKIEHKIDTPITSRGIMITAAASRFEQQIIIPITISQAYTLYCLDKSRTQTSPEETYIYWQAMNGDMMLTVSNEQIQMDGDQTNLQCLVCYVAEKPPTNCEDYHETYSYLNDGQPYQHDFKVGANQFKVKSNRFYCGCNTDDFFTFCLKMNHKTGQVSLQHAGPNSIYNHQKIQFQFDKSNLDLSKSEFIYVSAGAQDVPIRNLTINFEPIKELHPSFDKDFKIDTSALFRDHQNDISPHHYPPPTNPTTSTNDHRSSAVSKGHRPTRTDRRKTKDQPSFFARFINKLFRRPKTVENPPKSKAQTLNTSKLSPCRDSVYCVYQFESDHAAKYSHPCRFNELCRNQDSEPNLTHEEHDVPQCSDDQDCSKKDNPIHRAQFRHTKLPDYLLPCRYQKECRDKSANHRTKYFHGETLPSIKRKLFISFIYSI
jgi:uncharacterized protein (TIGR02452 family)